MWNKFNDSWVTGIGIYDVPSGKWEATSNKNESYPVRYWFKTPTILIK